MRDHRRVQKRDLVIVCCLFFIGCQSLMPLVSENVSTTKSEGLEKSTVNPPQASVLRDRYPLDQPLVEDKYKLKPVELVETPSELDEKAFFKELFQDPQRELSRIREAFDKAVRKKRDQFKKDKDKQRLEFSSRERKTRQEILKKFEMDRKEFKKRNFSKEATQEFYQTQDEKRKSFFAEEREARAEFESEMRDRQKNFEDYMRDKINEFNSELRAFSKLQKDSDKERK